MSCPGIIKSLAVAFLTAGFCLSAGATVTETHMLGFQVGKARVDTLYNNNAGACTRIKEVLTLHPGTRISISSYSSPEGKTSRNLQLARQRAESARETILAQNPGIDASQIVIYAAKEDWNGVKAYLERSNKEWKEEALEILKKEDVDKKSLLQDLWVGEAWEDLLKNCFPALRRVMVQLTEDIEAENGSAEGSESVSAAVLHFGNGGSSIKSNFMNNATGLERMKGMAQSGVSDLYVYVKSSPEGDEAANERLGNRRGKAIETRLRQLGYTGNVNIVYQGEDWQGLAKAVEASTDIPDKQDILDVISNDSLSRNGRKKALQALSYGKTWLRMLDVEMSGLRSAIITDTAL